MSTSMASGAALFLAVATPWAAALACAVTGALRARVPAWAAAASVLATLPALAVVIWVPTGSVASLGFMLIEARLELGAHTRTFLLGAVLLWLASALFALGRSGPRRGGFHLFFLLAMAGNFGAVLAGDAITFYVHFATVSFAAWGLVIDARTVEAIRAGRIYIGFVLLGEAMVLPGLWLATGGLESIGFEAVAARLLSGESGPAAWLLLAGLGVKVGMLPFHAWLPLAHPVAPVPASAVLSGAIIKVGVLGWLQMLPAGVLGSGPARALAAVGLFAALAAAAVGLVQTRAKTVLGYSSVSQMGLATCALGLLLAGSAAGAAAAGMALTFFALHHGLAKSALFLACGVSGRRMALRLAILPAAVLAGLPFTSGATAKYMLSGQFADGGLLADYGPGLLTLSTLFTSLLMLRFLWLLGGMRDGGADQLAVAATALPVAGCVVLSVAALGLAPAGLDPYTLAPFVLAGVLGLYCARRGRPRQLDGLRVPEGDVVVALVALWNRIARATDAFASGVGVRVTLASAGIADIDERVGRAGRRLARLEQRIAGTQWFAVALLAVVLIVVILSG